MSNADFFSTGTQNEHLSEAEKAVLKRNLLSFMEANPVPGSMEVSEKFNLRESIEQFIGQQTPQLAFAVEKPLPLWFGRNFFGHLQPFSV